MILIGSKYPELVSLNLKTNSLVRTPYKSVVLISVWLVIIQIRPWFRHKSWCCTSTTGANQWSIFQKQTASFFGYSVTINSILWWYKWMVFRVTYLIFQMISAKKKVHWNEYPREVLIRWYAAGLRMLIFFSHSIQIDSDLLFTSVQSTCIHLLP